MPIQPVFSRRDFLKLALTVPFMKLAASRTTPSSRLINGKGQAENILIVVFDALSASHLAVHGYPRQTMPNLTRLAEKATVYHAHHSAGNFTTPGTASILTGVYPWLHRAFHLNGEAADSYTQRSFFNLAAPGTYRMAYSHNLLATILLYQIRADLDAFEFSRAHALADMEYSDLIFPTDYNTSSWGKSAILRGPGALPTSLFISQFYRFGKALRERLFNQQYGELFPKGIPNMNDVYYLLEEGIQWCMDELVNLPQPFLSYIHFMPPHTPYSPHKQFVGLFDDDFKPIPKPRHRFSEKGINQAFLNQQRQAYDEHLAYVDDQFARLYERLERSGLLENTWLIFTSDHGELFERGIWGHSTKVLYEPVIRAPLLIFQPGQTQRQDIFNLTSGIDLLPTLCQIMGQPVPGWSEGQVLPPFNHQLPSDERSIYAMEAKQNPSHGALTTGTFALLKGDYKLIHYAGEANNQDELYHLTNDPQELDERSKVEKALALELRQELDIKLAEVNS